MSNDAQSSAADRLAQDVAHRYASLPEVEAVALAGSRSSQAADANSDIDLYVYCHAPISLDARRPITSPAERAEIGNEFWEPGDEWVDGETGISVDVMFRDVKSIEERLEDVLTHHRASVGYSTCFWYNVRNSHVLFDRSGWLGRLKEKAEQPYPAELKRAVIAKNFPILRRNMSSYLHQIEIAMARNDLISVQHRMTALLASYFDVVFAVNEQPHPGEKRLIEKARVLCRKLPQNFPRAVEELLVVPLVLCSQEQIPRFARDDKSIGAGPDRLIVDCANELIDGLERLLRAEGFWIE